MIFHITADVLITVLTFIMQEEEREESQIVLLLFILVGLFFGYRIIKSSRGRK